MTRKGLFLLGAEAAESQLFTKQKAVTGAAASWCLTFSPAMGPVPKVAVSAQAGKGEPGQASTGLQERKSQTWQMILKTLHSDWPGVFRRLVFTSGACACLHELSLHSQPGREGAAPSISLLAAFHLGTQSRDNRGSAGHMLF